MRYWETKDALKELYAKAVQDPHVAWHLEYLKEKSKRIKAEEKYERLTRKIKENAVKEVSERKIKPGEIVKIPKGMTIPEFGKLVEERLEDDSKPIRVDIDSLAVMQEDRDQWKELAKYYGRLLEMEE